MKNLLAFVTFGNLDFTKAAVKSMRETVTYDYDMFAVIGKPGDWETKEWLDSEGILNTMHTVNMGFPFSVNDIYDHAWVRNDYDNIVLFGNDIVAYPYAVDSLLYLAENSDYEVISALQYDVKSLVSEHPDTARFFEGDGFVFSEFSAEPWHTFNTYSKVIEIADMQLYDIQNLCLYKRSVFEKIGYLDVNFFPAYFVDNDYARRIVVSGIPSCTLTNARFFHFWSRTIHQGSGGSNSKFFENNRRYYRGKWDGDFGQEKGHPPVGIFTRDGEVQTIERWRKK